MNFIRNAVFVATCLQLQLQQARYENTMTKDGLLDGESRDYALVFDQPLSSLSSKSGLQ
jgi:hypothetical protein